MDKSKPRAVITSKMAKNHLFAAKSVMDDTFKQIIGQRNRLNQMNLESKKIQQQQNQIDQKNAHEMNMNRTKLNTNQSL